jgi:hypothetical protein
MAQRVEVSLVDDIDGGEATATVRFGLDGTEYEIDLNDKNAGTLRGVLGEYAGHARVVSGHRGAGRPRQTRHAGQALGPRALSRNESRKIRAWARENGYDIKDRGRVPGDVVAKYQESQGAEENPGPVTRKRGRDTVLAAPGLSG